MSIRDMQALLLENNLVSPLDSTSKWLEYAIRDEEDKGLFIVLYRAEFYSEELKAIAFYKNKYDKISFQDFFEMLSEKNKKFFIFHLDIFNV